MTERITLEYLGTYWARSGDLFYATSADGQEQARVYVDSIGETWVDIRRIAEGGLFHTERIAAYRSYLPAALIRLALAERYPKIKTALNAHRVEQRGI